MPFYRHVCIPVIFNALFEFTRGSCCFWWCASTAFSGQHASEYCSGWVEQGPSRNELSAAGLLDWRIYWPELEPRARHTALQTWRSQLEGMPMCSAFLNGCIFQWVAFSIEDSLCIFGCWEVNHLRQSFCRGSSHFLQTSVYCTAWAHGTHWTDKVGYMLWSRSSGCQMTRWHANDSHSKLCSQH